MSNYSHWSDRVKSWGNQALPDRIRYTRKSTEGEDRQIASHEQQIEAMDLKWGPIDAIWWWSESRSGTTLDRPGLQDMLDFCKKYPRPISDPGKVEMFDPSRFGRSLDAAGKPDVFAFISIYHLFEQCGWQLHFSTLDRTGNQLGEIINLSIFGYSAAVYSQSLSQNVSRGMRNHGSNGWWTGGAAPWGTQRFDTKSQRVLKHGELSSPGGGGTILVPNDEVLHLWEPAAKELLAGASYKAIGIAMADKGIRGPRGGSLGHISIKNFLSNPVLIGEVEYATGPNGAIERHNAQWPPMVDVDLFRQVEREIERRENQPRNKKRISKGTFIVRPVCAHCGVEYHGGRNGRVLGNQRTYVHGKPGKYTHPEAYEKFTDRGCRGWSIVADELEDSIKDVILRERGSQSYEDEVREILLEREQFRSRSAEAISAAKQRVAELKNQYRNVSRVIVRTAAQELDTSDLEEGLGVIAQQLTAARGELEEAEEFAASREIAWGAISATLNETRDLAAAWGKIDLDERRTLLDWWVLDVLIVVEPIPGMKRANQKTAIVTLRNAPNAPRYFSVGRQLPSADPISSRTPESDSIANCSSSAQSASADPMRPSAQAACDRTNGSGSESAEANTGTASGDPQLPSATATLRKKPARPARRTGEPRENDSQAASSMAINSTSEGEAVPGCETSPANGATPNGGSPGPRAANAGSAVGFENFRENGHTS